MKKQKGITLIALIITIIVMLILAGVTINLTLGENGIFTTAQQAAKNYTDAQNKELAELNNFSNLLNNTINDIGKDNVQTYKKLSTVAKPGDYVEYDGGNGYKGLWQVLYNDEIYGLQIISADTVIDEFSLGGDTEEAAKVAYNNAIDTLNDECKKYVNIAYAKDVNSGRCVGSDPLSPEDKTEDTVALLFDYNSTDESGCKIADNIYLTDYNAMKTAINQSSNGIHSIGKAYWLASRFVNSNSSFCSFQTRSVYSAGSDKYNSLWKIESNGTSTPRKSC